jgi:hypothetical protein
LQTQGVGLNSKIQYTDDGSKVVIPASKRKYGQPLNKTTLCPGGFLWLTSPTGAEFYTGQPMMRISDKLNELVLAANNSDNPNREEATKAFQHYEEEVVISLVIDNPDVYSQYREFLDPSIFQRPCTKWLAAQLYEFWDKSAATKPEKSLPSRELFIDYVKNNLIYDELYDGLQGDEILRIVQNPAIQKDVYYIQKQLETWLKERIGQAAVFEEKNQELLIHGDISPITNAYERIEKLKEVGGENEPWQKNLLPVQEFLALETEEKWDINEAMRSGQPMGIVAPSKCNKTQLMVDAAVSLVSGTAFIGHFTIPAKKRVLFFSGESGTEKLQLDIRKIMKARNLKPADLDGLFISPDLPIISNEAHLAKLRKMFIEMEINVVIFDPYYLCITDKSSEANEAANNIAMGIKLNGIGKIARELGVTPIIVAHMKKGITGNSITNISYAGLDQWIRQWITISRTVPYAGEGIHNLRLQMGGSGGHFGHYDVEFNEKDWQFKIGRADPEADTKKKEEAKGQKKHRKVQLAGESILNALLQYPEGLSRRKLEAFGIGREAIAEAALLLLQEGKVREVEQKQNGKPFMALVLNKEVQQ